jgi:hypothetical protein
MKKFVYEVAGFEFVDTVPFGMEWKKAKAKAAELHAAVYRQTIKGEDDLRYEVYTTAGVFIYVEYVKPEMVKIF